MAQARRETDTVEPKRRRIRIRPAYVVLLVLMGLFAFKFVEKTQELQQLSREANGLRALNQQTMKDSARTRKAIAYYRSRAYVESRARQIWGYVRPGDVTIMSNPRYQPVATVRAAPKVYRSPQPIWKQWWSSFFS